MTAGPDRPVRTRSLRLRVATWVLILLLAVLTGLGLLVNILLRKALVDDLRTRLEDRAGFAALLQEQGVTGQTLADKTTGQGVLATFTAGTTEFVGRPSERDEGAPGPRFGGPRPRPAVTPSISYAEVDGSLLASVGLRDGTLQLRTSEAEIDRTLDELGRIELVAGAATVGITAVLLLVVVGRALRPLERMTALAARIRDGARGRRLRPTRPKTELGRTATTIDEMLDALETAEAAAQQAESRMRQFLADASHDLRTPLAGVIAGSEHLLRSTREDDRSRREQQLVAIIRQARRAGRLVDDLLLMTRLDAGSGGPAAARGRLDLSALLSAEISALRLRFPDLDVRLRDASGAVIDGDPDQMSRAVGNVLDNAARAGGPVQVSVISGPVVRIAVTDNGPGVPAEDRERIFERFVRLSESRAGAGSGLGLPISRAILRAHSGDLVCVATPSGARFDFVLPAGQAGSEPSKFVEYSMVPSARART